MNGKSFTAIHERGVYYANDLYEWWIDQSQHFLFSFPSINKNSIKKSMRSTIVTTAGDYIDTKKNWLYLYTCFWFEAKCSNRKLYFTQNIHIIGTIRTNQFEIALNRRKTACLRNGTHGIAHGVAWHRRRQKENKARKRKKKWGRYNNRITRITVAAIDYSLVIEFIQITFYTFVIFNFPFIFAFESPH